MTDPVRLWNAIQHRLDDSDLRTWRQKIDSFGQVEAAERRESGHSWTDEEVFSAVLRAVLSANTVWDRVEGVLHDLEAIFFDFSLARYSEASRDGIDQIVRWFKDQKAGSTSLSRSLLNLQKTTRQLAQWSNRHGSAESFFVTMVTEKGGDPKSAVVALGKVSGPNKLPAFGIPSAAEAMRNLGFDVGKPDRHLCRAFGSFNLVTFKRWPDRNGAKAPQASPAEMFVVMQAIEDFAKQVESRPTFIDNAVWLLCARKCGLHLSNAELRTLVGSG